MHLEIGPVVLLSLDSSLSLSLPSRDGLLTGQHPPGPGAGRRMLHLIIREAKISIGLEAAMTLEAMQETIFDVVIIGAGMGGGMAGRRLAEAGRSVLFVEKGTVGYRREEHPISASIVEPVARQVRGFWPKPLEARINGRTSRFFGPIGSGVGGSSVFYAAALERPEPHDMDDQVERPHPTGGWPAGFSAFVPYFEQAEEMLSVCGEDDPISAMKGPALIDPPELSEGEAALMAMFRSRGLHPYRQHSSIRYLDQCRNCAGFKCPRTCKMDGRSAGVEPALATGRAELLANCEVTELLEDSGHLSALRVRVEDKDLILRARYFVLAAGALGSPALLLASRRFHENGCANSSGWVGRGLMFHLNEIFAVWPPHGAKFPDAVRSISLRDFYYRKSNRLGIVQAMGLEASYGNVVQYLNGIFDRSILRRFRRLRHLTRVPALIGVKLFGNAKIFVGLLEDLAYPENRVVLNEDDREILTFHYTISEELHRRRALFRSLIRKELGGWRMMFLNVQPELNFGHPIGTLRFGNDPKTSVLNRDCKSHDLDNLYVADASFMPSSLGVNPSLTIAANALRVADIIAARLADRAGK